MSTRESARDLRRYRLKVTLRRSRPPIWRRLEVDAGVTLAQLHDILQIVMGWTDSHLHQFRRGSTYYGQPDPELGMERENERRIRLREVLRRPKDRMVYEYDFGDGWEHDIVLEAIGEAGGEKPPVRVVTGKEERRPHVHIQHADGEAKFWIEPAVELHANYGLKPKQIAEAEKLVGEHLDEIRNAWAKHFPG